MNTPDNGFEWRRFCTLSGPPAPWYSEGPFSWSSDFLKYGNTSSKLQPAAPASAQLS
jgi:hypothetical protein